MIAKLNDYVLVCESIEKIMCHAAALYPFFRIFRLHWFIFGKARFTATGIQQRIGGDGRAVDQYESHRGP